MRPPAPDARALIRRAVGDLERAIASEDISRLRTVYSDMPRRSADQWQGFFDRADDLRVELRPQSIGIEGTSGAAVVTAVYEYQRRGRTMSFVDTLEIDFRRSDGAWRVTAIRN